MNSRLGIWIGAVAVVGIAGCSGGTAYKPSAELPVTKATSTDDKALFPLKQGNYWIYTVTGQRANASGSSSLQPSDLKCEVASIAPIADGIEATVAVSLFDKVTDKQIFQLTSKGLYQVSSSMNGARYSSPEPLLQFPVKVGDTYVWTGTEPLPNGETATAKITSKVLGYQDVDTEGGRYSALAVESNKQSDSPKAGHSTQTSTTFFSPTVGLVRFYSESTIVDKAGHKGAETQTLSLKLGYTADSKK